jgi:hypothetical protein
MGRQQTGARSDISVLSSRLDEGTSMTNFVERIVARRSVCRIETHLDARAQNVEMSLDAADMSVRATSDLI